MQLIGFILSFSLGFVPTGSHRYSEGVEVPRNLTAQEARLVSRNPITAPRGVSAPPLGSVHCVAEYEPMESLLLAWEGSSSWKAILAKMAAKITTIGNADVVIVVDYTGEESDALTQIALYGGVLNRVVFVVRTTDTIWIRDYGPRYIYEGGCRAIVDHTYNRPRPNDNALSSYLSTVYGHKLYSIPLVHGGGNYHLNSFGNAWATELILNENPSMSEATIVGHWQDFQNVNTTVTAAFPTWIDSTQHIDMWMCWVSDTTCVISDWPFDSGSTQDSICDAMAISLQLQGYTVVRIPARSVGGTHYTYANSVICNDLVLVPSYTNSQVSQHNAEAITAWEVACPSKTVISIPCQSIVTSAGVMHCIVMHVPLPLGGAFPTAYLQNPQGGEVFDVGQQVPIIWLTDDDHGVTSVDIELSTNGGSTWQLVVAGTPAAGFYSWQIPDIATTAGVLRITAHDADGQTGSDQGDGLFTINGTAIPGDVNGDGVVNVTDILLVMANWGVCDGICPEDLSGDGLIDVVDLLIIIGNW